MTDKCTTPSIIKIGLEKNIQLCLNSGFDTLVTAHSESDYRIAVTSIHDGLELLMKFYLSKKDELLIYNKINHEILLPIR